MARNETTYDVTGTSADMNSGRREPITGTVTAHSGATSFEVRRAVKDQLNDQGKAAIDLTITERRG